MQDSLSRVNFSIWMCMNLKELKSSSLMSGPLVDTLKRGEILIIDELDARLHPLLTKEIVRLFNDPQRKSKLRPISFHDP